MSSSEVRIQCSAWLQVLATIAVLPGVAFTQGGVAVSQTTQEAAINSDPEVCFTQAQLAHAPSGEATLLKTVYLDRIALHRALPKLPGGFGRIEGTVRTKVLIDSTGDVKCAARVTGHPLLAQISIQAARLWRFRPYEQDGKATAVLGFLDFRFSTGARDRVEVDRAFEPEDEPPRETTICELVKDPARFNGRTVRVRGTVFLGRESSVLLDKTCSAQVWLAGPYTTYLVLGITPLPNERPVKVENESEYRKLARYLSKEYRPKDGSRCLSCPLYEVTLTVNGRFDHVSDGEFDAKGGFGHLNAYQSQLSIRSVSEVVAKPIDTSGYEGHK